MTKVAKAFCETLQVKTGNTADTGRREDQRKTPTQNFFFYKNAHNFVPAGGHHPDDHSTATSHTADDVGLGHKFQSTPGSYPPQCGMELQQINKSINDPLNMDICEDTGQRRVIINDEAEAVINEPHMNPDELDKSMRELYDACINDPVHLTAMRNQYKLPVADAPTEQLLQELIHHIQENEWLEL